MKWQLTLGRHDRDVALDWMYELTSGERHCESLLHMDVGESDEEEDRQAWERLNRWTRSGQRVDHQLSDEPLHLDPRVIQL
jgi:ferric-dicitrate binding protein FerR (iron transport regulator)